MKIIIIITGLGMGGAERQICDLSDKFNSNGHHVKIISITNKAITKPISKNIEIQNIYAKKNIIDLIRSYLAIRKSIISFNPNVIHSHMFHANIFARLLRLTTKIPRLICTAHSSNEGGKLRMLAYRLTGKLADLSTNVSAEAVQEFVKKKAVKPDQMRVVYNGVDTNRFCFNEENRTAIRTELNIDRNTPLLLAVGRLTEAKDYSNLLRAIEKVYLKTKNFMLVIIGEGELHEQLSNLVNSLRITEHVHFIGLRHDIERWLSAADIFVMSSKWEGLPLALLEAMACERVIVATDCGGIKAAIGQAGLIAPPQDTEQLALSLEQALQMSHHERAQLGETARQRVVQQYSLDATAKHWLEIYQGKTC